MFKLSTKVILVSVLLISSQLIAPGTGKVTWLSTKEVRCLVDNVYHESRGEPWLGQILVARVTLNRANSQTICQTVYQPKQFSWTSHHKQINRGSSEYATAYYAAYAALNTKYEATYYHSIKVNPKWAKKFTKLDRVGNHIFYKAM